jgi:AraC family transcriptional regulator
MSRGRARLEISQGLSVWVLDAPRGFGDADFHARHAIQITASLTGALTLTSAQGAQRQ